MADSFLYNNPNVILPLEIRLAINRLRIGRNQKMWHYREKRAGRKVKESCTRHNKDRHELIQLVSRRHLAQKTGSPVLIGFQNVRSLNNKVEDVVKLIQDYKMHVVFMAETGHDPESISISELRSQGFVVFEKARPRLPGSVNTLLTNHGGVAVAFNSMFRGMLLQLTSTASFEHLCVRISSSSKSVIGLVVYRTVVSPLFHKEFENTLGFLATYNEEVLILGDFNFHLEQPDNTDAQTFLNILRSHGFDSSTNQPTHNQGGWLDVIASRKSVHIDCIDSGISDHKLLLFSYEMLKPPSTYRQLQIRCRNILDTEKFISELKLSPLSAATGLDVESVSDLYNSTLSKILDKMIPFKTVRIRERPSDP